jgi:hypothetical protein
MNLLPCLARITSLLVIVSFTAVVGGICLGQSGGATGIVSSNTTATPQGVAEDKKDERREFQSQELMLAKSGGWIFKPGKTPQVV